MDFNPSKQKTFELALFPPSIREETKNYSTLESFIYIIRKKFNPFEGSEKMNLVKIGYSSIRTRSGDEKGLSRLLGFRTSLISFDVFRFYLYENDQYGSKSNRGDPALAHRVEQKLHEIVSNEFKPKTYRIKFSNGNESEWFHIPDQQRSKFLNFCDRVVFNHIHPNVLTGTEFTKSSFKEISIKREPKIVGVTRIDKKRGVKAKQNPRKIDKDSERLAMSLKQAKTMDRQLMRQAKAKQDRKDNRKKLAKTVEFWKDVFVKKQKPLIFHDKKMFAYDKGKYPNKVITDVIFLNQPVVVYEPLIKNTRRTKISEAEREDASGFITIHEALDYFPKIKEKYRESYVYFKEKNHYEDEIDYGEIVAR